MSDSYYSEEVEDILRYKIHKLEEKIKLLETTIELLKEAQQEGQQHG